MKKVYLHVTSLKSCWFANVHLQATPEVPICRVFFDSDQISLQLAQRNPGESSVKAARDVVARRGGGASDDACSHV